MSPHVSTLTLHRYRYGELDPGGRAEVDEHLKGCDRCRSRLRVQQAEREQFVLEAVPPALAAVADREAATPSWRALRWRWAATWLVPVALVAAAALLFLLPGGPGVGPDPDLETVRVKGDHDALEVWLATPAGPRKARPGDRLHPGDRVQLVFDPQGAPFVALAGRDGTGEVEVWKLVDTRRSPDGLRQAPFGLTLDDTPGDQEFFLVPLDRPVDEPEIARFVRQGKASNGHPLTSVVIAKE